MRQRKVMKLWQMILIIVLAMLMIVTMFLPAIQMNGANVRKAAEKIMSDKEDEVESGGIFLKSIEEKLLDKFEEGFDDKIKKWEEDHNTKIASISPFHLITHNFFTLVYGDDITEDEIEEKKEENAYKEISGKYTCIRILLWVLYAFPIVILLLVLFTYFFKWSKIPALIISTVYGVIAAVIFTFFRFWFLKGVEMSLKEVFGRALKKHFKISFDLSTLKFPELFNEVIPVFYSIAFLVAFIIAVLLLIVSVVSMFVGNRFAAEEEDWYETSFGALSDGIEISKPRISNQAGVNPFGGVSRPLNQQSGFTETVNDAAKSKVFVTEAATPFTSPMGQVKCTKGVAFGSGFMLPQDRKVIVGKNPKHANLVIDNPNVSNLHCSIRYKAQSNSYIVKDHSMNGTFVNGTRLKNDVPYEFTAGTVLSLADGSNEITLG